jgi:cobalt-zinc-cadmium efflux system membrane fusion protein
MNFDSKAVTGCMVAAMVMTVGISSPGCTRGQDGKTGIARTMIVTSSTSSSKDPDGTVTLSKGQRKSIRTGRAEFYPFSIEKPEFGTIDYDNNIYFDSNLSKPVYPPLPGTIQKTFVELDETVQKGQPLYSIDSPTLDRDLEGLQAAKFKLDQATREFAQARKTSASGRDSQVDPRSRASARLTAAQRSFESARNRILALGQTAQDIDRFLQSGTVNPVLIVTSPMAGRIAAVNAIPGMSIRPGSPPAPYQVAHVSVKWMLAYVPESDSPLFRVGQEARVKVMAFPGRVFAAKVARIYPTIDPNNHRITIRYEIKDPKNELRSGMVTEFMAQVEKPSASLAVPVNGVVREGDGTMTVWVEASPSGRFVQRVVQTGLMQNGHVQILGGLRPGERIVTDGAIFLDNILQIRTNG